MEQDQLDRYLKIPKILRLQISVSTTQVLKPQFTLTDELLHRFPHRNRSRASRWLLLRT